MKKYVIVSTIAVVASSLGQGACGASYLSSQWNGLNANAAPCEISGDSINTASQCSTWCKNQYAYWVDNSSINFVTSIKCENLGIKSDNVYCCVNNAITVMFSAGDTGCHCPGENRTTVLGEYAISKTLMDSEIKMYEFKCNDYKCFCDNGYYGATKKLSQSLSSDTCTKCPDMESNNYGYNHAKISGQTFNNISEKDDSKAPATSDITACNIAKNCPMSPYCDRYDETGKWQFTSDCYYKK